MFIAKAAVFKPHEPVPNIKYSYFNLYYYRSRQLKNTKHFFQHMQTQHAAGAHTFKDSYNQACAARITKQDAHRLD